MNHAIFDLRGSLRGHKKLQKWDINIKYRGEATYGEVLRSIVAPLGASRYTSFLTLQEGDGTPRRMDRDFGHQRRGTAGSDWVARCLVLQDTLERRIRKEKGSKLVENEQEVQKLEDLKK